MKTLHVDTGREVRGGQHQAIWLVEGLVERGVPGVLVARRRTAMSRRCRARGLPVRELPLAAELDLYSVLRMAAWIRGEGFDLVHAHTSHAHGLAAFLKLGFPRLPLVVTRRVAFPVRYRGLTRWKYDRADAVVCISRGVRDALVESGLPPARLRVVHSGVPADRFPEPEAHPGRAEAELGLPPGAPVVGSVGSLERPKGYDVLLDALCPVLERRPGLHLVIVGEGPERERLEERVNAAGLGGRVHLPGYRPEIRDYLARFDVYVNPARSEGLGVAVIEALGCGLPAVVTRAGGLPEIVEDGVNGLVVPPEDPDALRDAVDRLLDDRSRRRELAEAARTSAGRWSADRMVEGNLAVYRSLLEEGGVG